MDVLLVGAEEMENLGTRYLAAVLVQHSYSAEIVAFSMASDIDGIVQRVQVVRPRLVGLSMTFQYRAREFLALAAKVRSVLPGVHITAGGHFATCAATDLLHDYPALDSVVRGEGEYTLLELVQKLDNPEAWSEIAGLAYRHAGEVVENPPRPLIADLDSLPFPARTLPLPQCLGVGCAAILGSRGCYRDCAFCSIHAFYRVSTGKAQRFRSMPNLVDEMELLYEQGVRFFFFNDDEWFPLGKARQARVAALQGELLQRRLDVIMSIRCRADDVEEDLFRRLRDTGVVAVYVGVESGSDRSLRFLNKRTTVAQNRRAMEVLDRLDMLAGFGMIFFDPESTVEDIRANIDFCREVTGAGQAFLSLGRLEMYAGTAILELFRRQGRLHGDYLAWDYTIADPRVEKLFRLVIATMSQRFYARDGLARRCAEAYTEQVVCKHLLGRWGDIGVDGQLHHIIARANAHSLAMLEEMLDFVRHEDIRDTDIVNDRVVAWAGSINWVDLQLQAELAAWRAQVAQSSGWTRR